MTNKLKGTAIIAGSITQSQLSSGVNNTANSAYAAANSAANTVRVLANSASTQNAVSLNFINTSSISVTVESGSTGNANVSFRFTGSGTPDFVIQSYGII